MPLKKSLGMARGNQGRGRQQNGFGLGPAGECICPNCGQKQKHQRGLPCYQQKCPNCGSAMSRAR